MKDIIAGDNHYLAICGILTVGMQLACFAIAYGCQFDKVTDFAGSTNFILIALLTFFANGAYSARQIAITVLVCLSRLELASYLLYRVLKRGKDDRFDQVRTSFVAFLTFWVFQMVWAWGVSLPVMFVNGEAVDPPFGCAADVAGIVIFALSFLLEVAADLQKDAFRSNPANRGRVCDAGVWGYSRHPNFAGEIGMWWGLFILASPVFSAAASAGAAGSGWGYATILSPLLTFLILMCGSGMPTAEGDNQQRYMKTRRSKEAYLAYRHRTSPLLPLPPVLYARVPLLLKRVLLFEWPMYETDWSYCGEEAGRGILPPHLSSGSASIPGSQSPSAASALMPGAGGGAGPATVANSMRASIGGGASARDARLSVAPPSAHAPTDAVAAVAVNPMDGGSRAV